MLLLLSAGASVVACVLICILMLRGDKVADTAALVTETLRKDFLNILSTQLQLLDARMSTALRSPSNEEALKSIESAETRFAVCYANVVDPDGAIRDTMH